MTITVNERQLVVPSSVQRQAGIKSGDRLMFRAAPGSITITTTRERTYKPTKAELAAIRRGEAAIARGEYVSLTEFLHEMDRPGRNAGTKAARKVSR